MLWRCVVFPQHQFLRKRYDSYIIYLKLFLVVSAGNIIYKFLEEMFPPRA